MVNGKQRHRAPLLPFKVVAYLTDDLLLGGVLRYEDFTTFGSTTNYKLTLQYTATDDLSFRASTSTGFEHQQ
jgi:iron complex outermembrane receptor protein